MKTRCTSSAPSTLPHLLHLPLDMGPVGIKKSWSLVFRLGVDKVLAVAIKIKLHPTDRWKRQNRQVSRCVCQHNSTKHSPVFFGVCCETVTSTGGDKTVGFCTGGVAAAGRGGWGGETCGGGGRESVDADDAIGGGGGETAGGGGSDTCEASRSSGGGVDGVETVAETGSEAAAAEADSASASAETAGS